MKPGKGEVLLTLAILALLASPSSAHAPVKAYSPKAGATVGPGLERAVVVYSGTIRGGTIVVRRAGGAKVSRGDGHVARRGRMLRARIKGRLRRGPYTVSYRAIHTDGDATTGTWSFRVR